MDEIDTCITAMAVQVIQPHKVHKATSVQDAGRYQFDKCTETGTETYGNL